jgi:tRNA threonylcarbamoyladenosine biosynthesis protein TsaB
MALILALEASVSGCSVALFEGNYLISKRDNKEEKSAAALFTTYIKEILVEPNKTMADLEAIAVSKGPGSYTGLRVAVSTAKGLCMALDIPLISYESLDALASQINEKDYDYVIPLIDARRAEVFYKVIQLKNFETVQATEAHILSESSFEDWLNSGKTLFVGNGAEKSANIIKHPNRFYDPAYSHLNAAMAHDLVFQKFKNKEFEDLTLFEPFYLKEYMFKQKTKA